MKVKYTILVIAAFAFYLSACKKDGNLTGLSNITGKWNIVSDSTFVGVGESNRPANYQGQPGDYFDFRTNDTLYTKEGSVLDTLKYSYSGGHAIIIQSFGVTLNGVAETSNITSLTANTFKITAPVIITPGGEFGRKISLSR